MSRINHRFSLAALTLSLYTILFALLLSFQADSATAIPAPFDLLGAVNKLRCGINIASSTLKSALNKFTKPPPEISPDAQEEQYLKLVSTPTMLVSAKADVAPNPFTEEMMYRYGMYAGIAYCDEQDARSLSDIVVGPNSTSLLTADMRILNWNNKKENNYFIAKSDKQRIITISFRGTASINDMLADIDSRKVDPDASLGASPANSHLETARANNPGYGIVLTGHSLGGVAAHLFGLHLRASMANVNLIGVFTYGEPISMSETMASWSLERIGRDRYVRVVSSDDIAPWIRTSDGEFGHASTGQVIYLPKPHERTIVRCDKADDTRCGAGIPCTKLGWTNHSWYGGMFVGKRQCLYGRERKNPLLDVPPPAQAAAPAA
ncbi:Alpha/Beta hydrolase protein [Syncephalis fuscata]|nr:Alpha/Beta hydrolase protein [Syncephalis fuscata]